MNTKLRRTLSRFLVFFALTFGITWKKQGFCLGDWMLNALGLPAWSQGTQGFHYTVLLTVLLLLLALFLYPHKQKRE